jgi:hypothetical protein
MLILGADIGQATDPTALAVVQHDRGRLAVRHLERVPLGTPYPETAQRIAAVLRALPGPADLIIDATGVGRAVADILRADGLAPIAVTFTAGKVARGGPDGWRVPKRDLVRVLAGALEDGRLQVARSLPEADVLVQELAAFSRTVSASGRDNYAGRGAHDDIVCAVAVAVWWASLNAVVLDSGIALNGLMPMT